MPRDIANVFELRLCNHIGTHIDGPNHFSRNKPTLIEWPIKTFVYESVAVLDMPKGNGRLITADDLIAAGASLEDCELLLFRTGFGFVRETDPQRYRDVSPGFTAAAAQYIMDKLPTVRCVGIDSISLACARHLDEGIKAHQILMDNPKRSVFAIEDMNMQFDLTRLRKVYALPLLCEKLDSAPCTVLAELE